MSSESDAAREHPHLYLIRRWGPVAPELVRVARLFGRRLAALNGIPTAARPLDSETAKRALGHAKELLALVRKRIPESYEASLRELVEGLGTMPRAPGRRDTDRRLFARDLLVRWEGLPLALKTEGPRGERKKRGRPERLDWRDLLALARCAGVERCTDDPLDVDREWRRLCKEIAGPQQ